jgi:hypothetical protein
MFDEGRWRRARRDVEKVVTRCLPRQSAPPGVTADKVTADTRSRPAVQAPCTRPRQPPARSPARCPARSPARCLTSGHERRPRHAKTRTGRPGPDMSGHEEVCPRQAHWGAALDQDSIKTDAWERRARACLAPAHACPDTRLLSQSKTVNLGTGHPNADKHSGSDGGVCVVGQVAA